MSKDIIKLRKQAHQLKPVVIIGANGLSENVMQEINLALDDHELIKVKIATIDKDFRKQASEEICNTLGASLVQRIGHMSVFYRKSEKQP